MKTFIRLIALCGMMPLLTHAESPTFHKDIAPIIYQNCTSCHREGEAGPFHLTNYKEIKKRGRLIFDVVEEGFMPPWHVRSADLNFDSPRALSSIQKATIRKWVDSGMPEGDIKDTPAMPEFPEGWQLGEPDLIVKMTEAYSVHAEGPDIYRNFVIPLDLPEDKWIKAIEFRPGNSRVVHHCLFFYDTTDSSIKADAADPIPGFKRMGLGAVRSGGLGGWAVGATPRRLPDELAFHFPKGADLILSTHFHPTGKEEKELSTLGLYFADAPPKYHFTTIQLPPVFGALAGVAIPPGATDYSKTDSFTLPVDVKAFGVGAHAHYLGKSMEMTADLPDGKKLELMNIPQWDFAWQEQYLYEDFVLLPKGTRISAKVTWDNSADNPNNPSSPPVMVKWGRESLDEMGSTSLRVMTESKKDIRSLNSALGKHRRNTAKEAFIGRRRQ